MELHHQEILNSLRSGALTDEAIAVLEKTAKDLSAKYKSNIG